MFKELSSINILILPGNRFPYIHKLIKSYLDQTDLDSLKEICGKIYLLHMFITYTSDHGFSNF